MTRVQEIADAKLGQTLVMNGIRITGIVIKTALRAVAVINGKSGLCNGLEMYQSRIYRIEEETILSFLDEILLGPSLPMRLEDAFSRGSMRESGNHEFMVKNQLICIPNGTDANPTFMLPSAYLIANGVEILFSLAPVGFIPNLNKLFSQSEQAGISLESDDVLMLFSSHKS